uniref:beta strand repeat-containing protein n=1 Tax=Treponema primitia TaxID=88058 RepID=UPI0002554DA4
MKNIRKTMHVLSLASALAVALLLGSCANPFAPDKLNPAETTIPQGYGRLLVSLGLEEPAELAIAQQAAPDAALQAARTLIPGNFTRYEVIFTNDDATPVVVTKTWTAATGNVVDLIPGTWSIAVTAYAGTGAGEESGTGQATVVVDAATEANISIPLRMQESGSGTLSYSIAFPGSAVSYGTKRLIIYNDDGTTITPLPEEGAANPITFTTSPATGTVSLNAGGYYLVVELENSQGRFARWTTAFHIYNGQTTPAAHSFGDGDFEESIPVSGSVTVTVGDNLTLSEVTVSAYGTEACDGLPVAGPVALASVTTGGTYTLFIPNRYPAVWLRLGAKDSADQPVSNAEALVTEVPINEAPVTQNLSAGIYTITSYAADGGRVTAPSAAFEGSTVAVTVSPAPGYFQSGKLQYTDSANSSNAPPFDGGTFTMPALNVTLSANFALIATGGETDVAIVNNVGYDNLNAAFAAVPAGTGTAASPVVITVLKSTATGNITVDGGRYVQLVGAGYTTATITFNENTFLEVKAGAGLILGDGSLPIALDGDAKWTDFDTGEHAGVSREGALVQTAGAFTIKGSARVQNNYGGTTGEGGGVYVAEATGNLVVDGGAIENNWASKGGGVYLSGAGADLTVTQYGSISGNAAETGGGVYLAGTGAALTVTQYGSISGNAAETGGGVYAAGGNSTLEIGGSVEGNLAQDGGGVYLAAVETGIGPRLNIRVSGAVKANQASRNGGGVYVGKNANLTMTVTSVIDAGNSATEGGGLYLAADATASLEGNARITGNTVAQNGKGPDAALAATLNLNGGALVSDAYLINAAGAIGVPGILTATVSAKITPHDYNRSEPVLTGVNVAANYTKFTLANPTAGGHNYMIRRTGSLVDARYTRYRNATTVDYYTTLADLLYDTGDTGFPSGGSEGAPDEIKIASGTSSITLGAGEGFTIPAGVHVKLVPPSGGFTITRSAASGTPVFTVSSGASLAIGGTTYALTLDGGSSTHTSPLVQVNGGTFTMGNIATLKNNKRSGDGGAVSVASGTFTMSGGTIGGTSSTKNTAPNGGAVSVSSGGSFTMSGGSITGNTA